MNLSKQKEKRIRAEFKVLTDMLKVQDLANIQFLLKCSPELIVALQDHWYADNDAVYQEVRRNSAQHLIDYIKNIIP